MSKKMVIGGVIALAMVVLLVGAIGSAGWNNMGDTPDSIPFGTDDSGDLPVNSINYQLFEEWGPIMLVIGILMFGAIIAGVCISREEDDSDDSS